MKKLNSNLRLKALEISYLLIAETLSDIDIQLAYGSRRKGKRDCPNFEEWAA